MVFQFKNKKGMLLAEETLKTVLAVMVIGVLMYFLVSLYFGDTGNQALDRAEGTMSRIENATASNKSEIQVKGVQPSGWYLFSFTGNVKPNQCAGKDCICICQKSWGISKTFDEDQQQEQCSSEGACSIHEGVNDFEPIEFKSPSEGMTNLEINNLEEGGVEISKAK
ncbi:MAG: hypothetical protein ABEI74_03135 [Candidatus Pacearchaeota archaeon]